jgi:ADP-heptose:LPS heptosyltransferase
MNVNPNRIVIFCLSGIGNTILFTPTLRILREKFPKTKITAVFHNSATAEVMRGSLSVDEIIVFNGSFFKKLGLLSYLKNKKFDISITAFPSNRFEFNLFSWLVNAKTRITHSYKIGKVATLSFLQNKKIQANENLHDVIQNLNLLKLMNIDFKKENIKLFFHLEKKDRLFANRFFIKNKLGGKRVIAIHPGTKKKDAIRRWDKEKFAELINLLLKDKKMRIVLFKGPDEEDVADYIYEKTGKKAIMAENLNLKKVGALIEKCSVFIGTDSGLGHIAAAFGVKTLVIFGPANPTRTIPYGEHTAYIRAKCPCSPALKYPFWSTSDKIICNNNLQCLKKLYPHEIYEELKKRKWI